MLCFIYDPRFSKGLRLISWHFNRYLNYHSNYQTGIIISLYDRAKINCGNLNKFNNKNKCNMNKPKKPLIENFFSPEENWKNINLVLILNYCVIMNINLNNRKTTLPDIKNSASNVVNWAKSLLESGGSLSNIFLVSLAFSCSSLYFIIIEPLLDTFCKCKNIIFIFICCLGLQNMRYKVC